MATCNSRESKYINNLTVRRQKHEDDCAYITRKHKLHNHKIWLYTPCGNGRVELFKQPIDFGKHRRDVRMSVWEDEHTLRSN